jgi:hypothetical protein
VIQEQKGKVDKDDIERFKSLQNLPQWDIHRGNVDINHLRREIQMEERQK